MAFIEYVPQVCLMVGLVAAIGIALGYPFAHLIGGRLAEFLSFLPREKFLKPQPALGIPATKASRGDLQGAVESYEELLLEHPHEREIYYRLLEIVMGPLHDEEYGEEVLRRGLANLKLESEKTVLLNLHDSIRSGSYHPFKHLDPQQQPVVRILPPLFEKPDKKAVLARSFPREIFRNP